ncbi:cathepsin L-like [Clavelina lepadiformis]|uniref:cathepsin L-like n=1 Tax=Clavelina lepadiformis TaxID=159417 RepID=UPI004042D1C7
MLKWLLFIPLFAVLVLCNVKWASAAILGRTLVGGISSLDLQKNPELVSELQSNLENFKQIKCMSKQVVAGMMYYVDYTICDGGSKEPKCTERYCSAKIWIKAWLSVPSHENASITKHCSRLRPEAWGNCNISPEFRPKRDVSDNSFLDAILVMGKPIGNHYEYDQDVKPMFDRFLDSYEREYSKDESSEIYQQRYEIFHKNLKIVRKLNDMEQGTAIYGITKFMDYSEDEYARYLAPGFTKKLVDIKDADLSDLDVENTPDSFDWREKGAVTPVKNQGQCGSCWAFSTTGNIEGQWFIKKKKLVSLSEQELVDCDSLDQGCGGGLPSNAYKSIEKLGGLEPEKDYPYVGENEKCDIKRSDLKVYINSSVALPTNEGKLAAWLAQNGPISIGINANLMQFYWGGISHPWKLFCNPKSLDHGVLIVGFGSENGTPYWIIKNSWGANWGEKGYYRIYRGDGSCGVNQMATSSIVE